MSGKSGEEMNNRRKLLVALGAGALAAPIASFAQQPAKIPRIGVLWQTTPPPPIHPQMAALLRNLHDLGW